MFWIPLLAGAAIGAMTSKDPLKGALMGAAVGATGGAAAGGLLGAGAAGAGAAGAAGASSAATTAGALAGDAFLPAAMGAGGSTATAGIAGLAPTGYTAAGLLGQAGTYAKPAMEAMQAAKTAQGLLGGDEPAPTASPMQPRAPLDLSSILQGNQQSQQFDMQEQERRKKEFDQYAMNMMGGR